MREASRLIINYFTFATECSPWCQASFHSTMQTPAMPPFTLPGRGIRMEYSASLAKTQMMIRIEVRSKRTEGYMRALLRLSRGLKALVRNCTMRKATTSARLRCNRASVSHLFVDHLLLHAMTALKVPEKRPMRRSQTRGMRTPPGFHDTSWTDCRKSW